MKKQLLKKLFTLIITTLFTVSFIHAQNCLTCNNGKGSNGKVSMYKSNYPDPGYQYACVSNSKVKQYQSAGWFVCYNGPGWLLGNKVPALIISTNTRPNTSNFSFSNSELEIVPVKIFDIAGRLVKTLVNAPLQQGNYQLGWNANDDNGNAVPAAVYFLQFNSGNHIETRKLVVMK